MCGIAGFVGDSPMPSSVIKEMTDVIAYRGPDDEGHIWFPDLDVSPCLQQPSEPGLLALGHRRLSIVDVSSLGHQPMPYIDGRYWLVYNGEIYNHLELRIELENLGYAFVSHSDTEIILAAYDAWGGDCLSRFNGMWSFALYDHFEKKLFLARDRFGVKPLYYWVSPRGVLFFGSEIKQFTVVDGWNPVLNEGRAAEFLAWGILDHTDETLFHGVYQLAPSHYALLDLHQNNFQASGRIVTHRWYEPKPSTFAGSYDDAVQSVGNLITDAVRLRLRADVTVGSCLSGGLDSSSIVCVTNRLMKEDGAQGLQKTFSAYSTSEKLDERKWVEMVVGQCDVDASYTYPDLGQVPDKLKELVWHQDEPFGSTSIYAQWCVFEMAGQQKVRVILDGQGADEHLGGYRAYQWARLGTSLRKGQFLTFMSEFNALRQIHHYPAMRILRGLAGNLFPFLHKSPSWLGLKVVHPEAGSGKVNDILSLSLSQLTGTNLCMLLHWEDRCSMAHSVESRVPFLDYRLVELVLGLPDEFKVNQGFTKRCLRDAMAGVLPDAIRLRTDKIGFATAEEEWLRGPGAALARNGVKLAIDHSGGLVTDRAMARVEGFLNGKERFAFDIWRLICFGVWAETFKVGPRGSA